MYFSIWIPAVLAAIGPFAGPAVAWQLPKGAVGPGSEGSAAQVAVVRPQLVTTVSQVLRQSRKPTAEQRAAMLDELARLGSQAVPACLYLLEIPVLDEHPSLERQAVNRYQRELLLAALAAHPRENVERALNAALQQRPQVLPLRVAAIEVLGRIGAPADLERLLQLALLSSEMELPKSVESILPSAWVSFARHHGAGAYEALELHWPGLRPPLVEAILLGFGELRDARALELIADAMRYHPDHASLAVSQILLVGRGMDDDVARETAQLVRGLLDQDRPHQTSAAVRALGVLEDTHSIPILIDLLEAQHEGVRAAASWALENFAGHQFAGDVVSQWRLWWAAELTWNDVDRNALENMVRSGDDSVVVSAARELAQHRVFRHDIALELSEVFAALNPDQKRVVSKALGILASPVATRVLLEAAGASDRRLAQAASEGLRSIHGIDLAPDRAAWERALGFSSTP